MKLSQQYINSHDIDWFATLDGRNIHVASAGAQIPNIVNNRKELRRIQESVRNLQEQYAIEINEAAIRQLYDFTQEQMTDYVSSFASMAHKGFYSYDKVDINNLSDDRYYLVAYPKEAKEIGIELPELAVEDIHIVDP